MRILFIEDGPAIAVNLYDFLEIRGHVVDAASDGVTGLHLAVTGGFDAIVLDLGLRGGCRAARTTISPSRSR